MDDWPRATNATEGSRGSCTPWQISHGLTVQGTLITLATVLGHRNYEQRRAALQADSTSSGNH
eukprot:3624680-Pleurochrysis_carterae.AAC.1